MLMQWSENVNDIECKRELQENQPQWSIKYNEQKCIQIAGEK